jgi:hypothetical protein
MGTMDWKSIVQYWMLTRTTAYPIVGPYRIRKAMLGTASKSDAIRPMRLLCKLHGGGCVRSYAKANSKQKGSCSQGNSRGLLESYGQSGLRGRCASARHRLIPIFWPVGPRTSPVVALRLPPANCLHPSGIRCPGRPWRVTLLSSICKPLGPKKPTRPLYAYPAATPIGEYLCS